MVNVPDVWEQEGIYTGFSAETYIRNTLPCLKDMCNLADFRKMRVPFQEDYHTELDMSDLLSGPDISKYKSLIGSGNWLITLGCFDIQYAISALSQYSMSNQKTTGTKWTN